MKILIVDDNKEKCTRLIYELNMAYKDIEIITKNSIYEAKKSLVECYYDVLILDLNMPLSNDSDCKEDAGYDLFTEMQSLSIYKKPTDIIFCTAFGDLHEKYSVCIQKGLFSIIHYVASSNCWIEQLVTKINYILKAKADYIIASRDYNFDVAIITAVEIEQKFVLNLIQNKEPRQIEGDPTEYICGEYMKDGRKISVVSATQYQMGMTAASVLSMKLINNFKPRVLAMVGIAAGKKGKGDYGDIIAPIQIWDYSSGKFVTKEDECEDDVKFKKIVGEECIFLPSPQYLTLKTEIKELLNDNFTKILNNIEDEWLFTKPNNRLKLIKGSMACGPAVIQNENIVKTYIDIHDRNVKGLDMESYGVMYAANNAIDPKPIPIIFKSICDFANKDKNDDYQAYAAYTSSRFLLDFLMNKLFV